MYIHPLNRWKDDAEILSFIQKNAFATLVTQISNKPWATHLPFVLDKNKDGNTILSGHVAKANLQWKNLSENQEVLVIFQGPHAYISSSWYNHENVPTWNYLAVHVYGKIKLIEGKELLHHLTKLVNTYEDGRPNRVSVETMSENYVAKQIKALVGFEVVISEVHGSKKLSQNRDDINHQKIVENLEESIFPLDKEVAEEMKKDRSDSSKS
ncbi:FMN-binding negative transcriptional regulator [Algoriphagus sp. D3-2-R+10]|uniref:FMN-binding negative transcriptional regulator n=1 Tax=Algoriphagus aurantiacus TaxID=3103948 RepID=UPI002B3F81A4|nr:FMN-binding negative transcriptional regulator [Algoriphagus sp. D3-2-R+10]MEB2777640.1 FMN-binding negative transcriptional regulator [Algoriphagus sp. D3-2-R+10]